MTGDTDAKVIPSTLPLLDLPFAYSQVPLLSSRQFRDEARSKWDQHVSIEDLEELHRLGLLVPLYRADDDVNVEDLAAPQASDNSRIARYAREGMIRDPSSEDPALWPHRRPDDAGEGWWDGFFYSEWQLLGLRDALGQRENLRIVPDDEAWCRAFAAQQRHEHVALAALSTRFFPNVVGRVTYRDGAERETLAAAGHELDAATRLVAADFPIERLRPAAEFLLSRAHTYDPMRQWWDLLRHSDANGWFRLRGGALEAIWQRIAAEVLLRAHEELAAIGALDPLPNTRDPHIWHPLQERIGLQRDSDGIHRSLARVGLSPEPCVVLVLEGETEMVHVPALLDALGMSKPRQVRVVNQRTSSDTPKQLARYVAPRLGRVRGDSHLIEAGPTALVVAMDGEGPIWGTKNARDRRLRELREIVRQEVAEQGGTLTDHELEILVQLHTWGDHKYELANFTNHELEIAITSVLRASPDTARDEGSWSIRLPSDIEYVRDRKLDIKVVFDRIQQRVSKVELAEALLPVLLAKLENDNTPDHAHPPVLDLAYDLVVLVNRLSGGGYRLETPASVAGQ
ncbi:hypothetical protein [Cryobacterium luteum]|uniref:Uncharacterized protein n=1 Tax=Cryobacterium luteum TaxID=1424661 RepID=A0A1H8GN45_9MICO|nr:hypothetical protein [Cryobacterium luteum]TFB84651.1 hypothetical protein E3O10_16165 [Cryobacterium luteum]SEN45164.1 hypothetical protein SAMN05216281_10812 [Cryobacterium luteum]